jgi:TetR/AcrR family transcriptional repressor of nem operon
VPRRSQTRERLLATATELFWSRGYADTGVKEIMTSARATSGSFYHFFPTKEELLLAVLDASRSRLANEVLPEIESNSDDLGRRIADLVDLYRSSTAPTTVSLGLPIGALVNELSVSHPEALGLVGETFDLVVSWVDGWLGGPASRPGSPADVQGPARLIVASLEGAAIMAVAQRSTAVFDRCVDELIAHLDSIVAPTRRLDEMPVSAASEVGDWKAW